jgi:hypothetical protein
MNNLEEHFTKTYNLNSWESKESLSGPGSERNSNLVFLCIDIIINLINKELTNTDTIILADIPCGDFNWIDILLSEIKTKTHIKNIEYYAYDIVKNIENDFNNKLKKMSNIKYSFTQFDATKQISIKADIILCKELFIHLSYDDINLVLSNFKKSNSSYLICSDHNELITINKNIKYDAYGECRNISLVLDPFNLTNYIIKNTGYKVWKITDLKIN